uniref:DMT family transporter n=1 Tax=Cyanobium sp. TaxID=2164130 RepID=UPI004048BEDA
MNDSQAWLTLLLAIAAEIAGTSLLKLSAGLTRPGPTVMLLLAYGCAIALVARVVMVIPLGITYALWSGIGTLAVVLIGALAYKAACPACKSPIAGCWQARDFQAFS